MVQVGWVGGACGTNLRSILPYVGTVPRECRVSSTAPPTPIQSLRLPAIGQSHSLFPPASATSGGPAALHPQNG